ncbi:hypothetical protein BBP40_005947 [Aspergillus hancockii]|nr:hypothetical protein BBP40_005947 [Aspergillus hancockii]
MPASSLVWSVGSIALSSLIAPTIADGSGSLYHLTEAWQGEKFLDHFKFYSGADPTNGFVTYANQSYAESTGLVEVTSSGSFYMGVDYKTTLSPNGPGRDSVRIESKEFYDEGLYIIDLKHMPGSVCGTWPAFWSVGPNWPHDGEIDIIEGVNKHESNEIVLHTSGSCALSTENDMTGTMTSSECGEASGTVGCVVQGQNGTSGAPFNQQGGGVYAMEWTAEFIKIWYFARSEIPQSITNGNPDTTAFGTPMAHLQGTCNFHERFQSQKFILDTTFCGDWAGGVFGTSGCPVSDPSNPIQSCVNYVAENPAAFKEAYWEINYIKLFQTGASQATSSVAPQAQTATASVSQAASTISSATSTVAPEPTTAVSETASGDSSVDATVVPEPAESKTTAVPAASTETTAAPAGPSSDDNEEGSDAVSQTTIYVTSTTTICSATQKGSIKTLGGGETDVSPASSSAATAVTAAVPTPTAQQPSESQTEESGVTGGYPGTSDVSPESPAAETGSTVSTPGAEQPEPSQPGTTSVDAVTAPAAASTPAPAADETPEGASPVGAPEPQQIPGEPEPTTAAANPPASVAPIHTPSPSSSWLIHSSSRIASSSKVASTTTSATHSSKTTEAITAAPTTEASSGSTGTSPESPVFTSGARKSVGVTGVASIVCGLVMAMLA